MKNRLTQDMTSEELETLRAALENEYSTVSSQIDTARKASDAHCQIKDDLHREMRPLEKELLAITKAVAAGTEPVRPFKEAFDQQQEMMQRFDQMCIDQRRHYQGLISLYDEAESIGDRIIEVDRFLRNRRHADANARILQTR